MGYKTLLTFAQPGGASNNRVKAAAALARDLDALLIGLAAEAVSPYVMEGAFAVDGSTVQMLSDQRVKDFRAAKTAFETHCEGTRREWRTTQDTPTSAMAHAARAADLLVVGGSTAVNGDDGLNVNALIVTAGRPVLVAPTNGGTLQARRILVAWKDTRESRRAVADALPFLMRADDVLIVSVCHADNQRSAQFEVEEVVEMLERHGVKSVKGKAVAASTKTVEDIVLDEAATLNADLIVAGGYGHSRATEWVLGGMTEVLLHQPTRFVLLSH